MAGPELNAEREPLPAALTLAEAPELSTRPAPRAYVRSYRPTRFALVNRLLDLADLLTGGRAVWLQRLSTYLVFGGTSAVVNLLIFALVLRLALPLNDLAHNLLAFFVAAEIALIVNFIPNDRITFSQLPGHSRAWWVRCARFHLTCAFGTALTYLIQFVLHYLAGVPSIGAEAVALVIVTAVNFSVHHAFTYRHVA
jgi:putative flippase GtrA